MFPVRPPKTEAQLANPILKIQDMTLDQCPLMSTDPTKLKQLLREHNHLKLWKGVLYQKVLPRGPQEALFKLVLLTEHRETTLKGCYDEAGHLGLARMLELMHNHFFWPYMAAQVQEHVKNVTNVSPSRWNKRGLLWKILWQPILWSWSTWTTCAWS